MKRKKITQNREPPAFQEYAAATMAKWEWRLMDAIARGVYHSMRLEAWVNRKMPNQPDKLAKIIGLAISDVDHARPLIMPFFKDDGEWITCPELDSYRAYLDGKHKSQSKGGKVGADITNEKRKQSASPENVK